MLIFITVETDFFEVVNARGRGYEVVAVAVLVVVGLNSEAGLPLVVDNETGTF